MVRGAGYVHTHRPAPQVDPTSDLRGGGVLSLEHLCYFVAGADEGLLSSSLPRSRLYGESL